MWFPLSALWRSRGSRTPPRRKPVSTRLTVEALEDRCVPAFLAPVTSVGGGVRLAVGDFNHDGLDDVAVLGGTVSSSPTSDPTKTLDEVAVNGTVKIYLSKGDGTFLPPLTLRHAQGSYLSSNSFFVRDDNGDGHLDVVLSTKDGPPHTSPTKVKKGTSSGTSPLPDGNMSDLPMSSYQNVWLGNGDGTFGKVSVTATPLYGIGPSFFYFHSAFADFNHDGVADRATVDGNSAVVSVSLGNHDGTFEDAVLYATGPSPTVVATGDFDGDGWADLLTTNGTTFSVSLNDRIWAAIP